LIVRPNGTWRYVDVSGTTQREGKSYCRWVRARGRWRLVGGRMRFTTSRARVIEQENDPNGEDYCDAGTPRQILNRRRSAQIQWNATCPAFSASDYPDSGSRSDANDLLESYRKEFRGCFTIRVDDFNSQPARMVFNIADDCNFMERYRDQYTNEEWADYIASEEWREGVAFCRGRQ
jgi:hypothetical protein